MAILCGKRKLRAYPGFTVTTSPRLPSFQPLYGDARVVPTAGLGNKLAGVKVAPIDTPNGTPLARVGVEVSNDLIYDLTGGAGEAASTHRLTIRLTSRNLQIIVDINSGRPDIQNYGIDARRMSR